MNPETEKGGALAVPCKECELYLFTPFFKESENLRAYMQVSAEDIDKIQRGCEWSAVVYDHLSKKFYTVRDADCGLPGGCHCAAVIVSTGAQHKEIGVEP